jgi:MSHA biogenesis protein MshK
MAQALKPLCALALAMLCGMAQAQALNDPTRPPAAISAPVANAGEAPPQAERAEPQLQSILVSLRPGGRRIAVIDGKIVRQGQRVGDAVLVAIGTTEVVLRRAGKTQTLKLFRPASRVATVQP